MTAPSRYSARHFHKHVFVRAACASLMLNGCVASTSYEQATSTAEVQLEAHRRTQKKLELLESTQAARDERLKQVEAERDELRAALAEREGEVSEAQIGALTIQKERDQQSDLVSQLRGELARVGGHLETYAGEKSELQTKLDKLAAENERLLAENERLKSGAAGDGDVGVRPGEFEDPGDTRAAPSEPSSEGKESPAGDEVDSSDSAAASEETN